MKHQRSKKAYYHNVEHRRHKNHKITRRVVIKGDKGHKSVTFHKNGTRHAMTIKNVLKAHEIAMIHQGKFIPGLFKGCMNCKQTRSIKKK